MSETTTPPPPESLVSTLDTLTAAAGTTTRKNRVLPQSSAVPAIPTRTGTGVSAPSS
mgnify:FL=1|jgi:hypothetical protein